MAEVLSPGGMMMAGGDGGLGFGSGGGLIGGLILGSLLRQGRGGLFGGDGDVAVAPQSAQATANMQLMQSIGQVDKAVAVGTAAMEASQATQTIGLTNQFNSTTGSLATRVEGVKDTVNSNAVAIMQQLNGVQSSVDKNAWNLNQQITADGDKTRALITQQYEATLNRQLGEANAALIELRNREYVSERTRGVEVNTTNNINQMQQQQQTQNEFARLYGAMWNLGQSIRDTNSAINVGSGTQTATNTPTNTNIR